MVYYKLAGEGDVSITSVTIVWVVLLRLWPHKNRNVCLVHAFHIMSRVPQFSRIRHETHTIVSRMVCHLTDWKIQVTWYFTNLTIMEFNRHLVSNKWRMVAQYYWVNGWKGLNNSHLTPTLPFLTHFVCHFTQLLLGWDLCIVKYNGIPYNRQKRLHMHAVVALEDNLAGWQCNLWLWKHSYVPLLNALNEVLTPTVLLKFKTSLSNSQMCSKC